MLSRDRNLAGIKMLAVGLWALGCSAAPTTMLGGAGQAGMETAGGAGQTAGNTASGGTTETAGAMAMGGATPAAGAPGAGGLSQGGSTAATPAYERLDCDLPAAIEYCGGATCHYDDAADLGSSLALWDRETQQIPPDVESRLINAPASYHNVLSPDACPAEPELLVDPANIEQSLMLKKLTGTHVCGDEMPKFPAPEWGATNNPGTQREEFVSCIRAWVTLLVEDYNQAP
jgi:hypothetical protein